MNKAGVGASGRQPYRGLTHQSHCSCSYELEDRRQEIERLREISVGDQMAIDILRAQTKRQEVAIRFVRDALAHARTTGHEHEWTPEAAVRMENRLNDALDGYTP